jgi:argininosuccinate lyase
MTDNNVDSNPWSGRFTQSMDALVEAFTESVSFDQRLAPHDIAGSIAHATMLGHVGVLSTEERDTIVEGLRAIGAEIEAGRFRWSTQLEDVHMNI